jgi:hypothetical protein
MMSPGMQALLAIVLASLGLPARSAAVSTARTAHLGHGHRIMARTTVTQGAVTRSTTVFSAAAAA